MSLMRWEPFRELSRLREEMDRLFDRVFGETAVLAPTAPAGVWSPSVDVYEEGENLVIKADLPGVKKEDVEITATEEAVTIEGRSEEEKEEKREGYYRRERRSGRFVRTVPLPTRVAFENAQATFQDGTVTITLPKVAEAPKGKKIAIK